jgi:hypothetical protein
VQVNLKAELGPLSNPHLIVTDLEFNPVDAVPLDGLSNDEWMAGASFDLPPMEWKANWPPGPSSTRFYIAVDHDDETELNGPYAAVAQ